MKKFFNSLCFFGISFFFFCTIIFLVFHWLPSTAVEALVLRSSSFGVRSELTAQSKAAFRQQLHLDDPLPKQWSRFIKGILSFDLGESIWTGQPVTSLIRRRSMPSLWMSFFTLVISLPLGLGLGLLHAYFAQKWQGTLISIFINILFCIPSFSIATFFVFSDFFASNLLAPLAVYLAAPVSYLAILTSRRLFQEEKEPYVTAVLAKGLSRWQLHYRHLFRSCWITALSFLPLGWSLFWGACLVVEPIFRIQGLGVLALEGYRNQDLPLLMGLTVILGSGRLFLNSLREYLVTRSFPQMDTQKTK